jgi:hypothetical protein
MLYRSTSTVLALLLLLLGRSDTFHLVPNVRYRYAPSPTTRTPSTRRRAALTSSELLSHRSEEWQDFGISIREQFPSLEARRATFLKVLSHRISAAATIEWNHHHVPLSPRSEEWQDFGGAIRIQLPSLEARFVEVMKLISFKISAAVNELKQHRVLLSPQSEEWQDFGGAIRIQLPSLEARFNGVMKLVSFKISAAVNELKQHRVLLSPRSEEWQDFGGAIRIQLPSLEAHLVEIARFSLLTTLGAPVRVLKAIERVWGVSKTESRKSRELIAAIRAVRLPLHSISESADLKKHRFLLSHQSEEWQDFGVAIRQQLPSLEARFVEMVSLYSISESAELKMHRFLLSHSHQSEEWQDFGVAIRQQLPSLEARFAEIARFSLLTICGGPARILRAIERVWGVSNTEWKEFLAAIRTGVSRSALALNDKFDEGVQLMLEEVPMRSIRMVRRMCKERGAWYRLEAVPFFC